MTPDALPDRRTTDISLGDTSRILAILYTLGFLTMSGMLFFIDVPENNRIIVTAVVSIMASVQTGIVGYYFGSSKNAEVSQKAAIVAKEKADTSLQTIAKSANGEAAAITTTTETKVTKAKK